MFFVEYDFFFCCVVERHSVAPALINHSEEALLFDTDFD